MATDAPTVDLSAASREWRSSLIDVGGNNRLLYFRPSGSTISLSNASQSALEKLLSGVSVRLSELFTDTTSLRAAQKACAALARKQREATEEFGVTVAFLAAGLASWNPDANDLIASAAADEVAASMPEGKPNYTRPSAPVLLRPVELNLRRGAQEAWELKLEDDFQLNGVLEHVMNADRERLDDERITQSDDGTLSAVSEMIELVNQACQDVPEFKVEGGFFLGAFSYLKQPMVADVDNLNALASSDLVAALAGDVAAASRVRTFATEITESQPDYAPVDSEFLVLDADASQTFVVNAALSGRNMVVEGPPGTGKSQTIANVIAGMVAAGKRVLFVAQKRAAVTAVLDRLEAVDLGHLVLDLFAATGSRRFVSEELRNVLDRQKTAGVPDVDELHFRLATARDRLVKHRDALFEANHGWRVSVADLRARSAAIPEGARTPLRLPAATFEQWSSTSLAEHRQQIDELDRLGALAPTWRTERGWNPDALRTLDAVAERTEEVSALSTFGLPKMLTLLRDASLSAGVLNATTFDDVDGIIRNYAEIGELTSTAPELLSPAVSSGDIEAMLIATDKRYRKAAPLKLSWAERRAAGRRAVLAAPGVDRRQLHSWVLRAKAARAWWRGSDAAKPFEALGDLSTSSLVIRNQLHELQPAVQQMNLDGTFAELGQHLLVLTSQASRTRMPRAFDLEQSLTAAGLAPVLTMIRAHYAAGDALPTPPSLIVEWVAIRSVLEAAELRSPGLAGLTGDDLNAATRAFSDADRAHLGANAARIRRLAAENLKLVLDDHPDQYSILKTEVTRKRNFRPVRALFREAPDVVLAAKPVWAMSPLQVSRLLPAEECFDVVIFDEASQVKPADAIPALLRARQAIVAGDSRQLPPTDFFSKVLEDDELSDDSEDETADLSDEVPAAASLKPRRSFTRDAESILYAMDRVLAGQSRRLLWHYRSKDERLIAVSNAGVYDYSLTTFPAADTADALAHVTVPQSPGIKNGTNSPQLEVEEVVDLVKRHVRDYPDESLGVITFGIQHQRRIEAALEEAASDDASLWDALFGRAEEPFFVKSIERVQGDERDAIILSVGYGKGADGKLRYFWGPLLQDGGERRLNVAISRARRRMTLVTSFSVDDVADDAHPSAGFKLMHRFIRFMASNGREIGGGPDRSLALNPFEIDIRDKLTAAGLHLDPQVGVGSYRIDFAVRHPDLPGKHVLAIEADGAAYHSGHIARERDRLRQTLLEARGWTFHRIWSTDWFNNADREIEKVVEAYQFALATKESGGQHSTTVDHSQWVVQSRKRQLPKPSFQSGRTITQYPISTLIELVRYLRSDDAIRTEDEELALMMNELGFSKRGSRIETTIRAALRAKPPTR